HEDGSTFWTDTFHGTLYFYWYAINVDFRVAFRMTNFTSAEAGGDDKIIFIARYEDNYQGEDSELHRFAHLSSRTDPDKITFHYKDTDKDHPGYGYGTFTIDTESFFSHPKTYDDFISIIAALVEVIE
ncbi:MAG: hypothetical protein KBS81_11320, partial [Spirochaetales bacterium]|nr:hypothetical protein [Candidatus Physcosoma equi]